MHNPVVEGLVDCLSEAWSVSSLTELVSESDSERDKQLISPDPASPDEDGSTQADLNNESPAETPSMCYSVDPQELEYYKNAVPQEEEEAPVTQAASSPNQAPGEDRKARDEPPGGRPNHAAERAQGDSEGHHARDCVGNFGYPDSGERDHC